MPRRQTGGGARSTGMRAPSRPSAPSQAPPAQNRPSSTAAAPPQQATAPPQAAAPAQSAGPGLFGQMASTAAGVAIGSSVGHAIGGLFSGGSSDAAPAEQQGSAVNTQQTQQAQDNCAPAASQFTKCMDDHSGNLQICNWYLEQLKACQAAAKQY